MYQFSRVIKSADYRMDLLVEEYDVLSRLEEIERGYKTKAIPKVDYIPDEKRLRDALFQLHLTRKLDQLELGLTEGLGRIGFVVYCPEVSAEAYPFPLEKSPGLREVATVPPREITPTC